MKPTKKQRIAKLNKRFKKGAITKSRWRGSFHGMVKWKVKNDLEIGKNKHYMWANNRFNDSVKVWR